MSRIDSYLFSNIRHVIIYNVLVNWCRLRAKRGVGLKTCYCLTCPQVSTALIASPVLVLMFDKMLVITWTLRESFKG